MDIGNTIKKLRIEKDLSQAVLSEALGVSVQTVSRWETGITYPDISLLPVLSNLFHVTSDTLLGIDIAKKEERIDCIIEEDQKLANAGKNETDCSA